MQFDKLRIRYKITDEFGNIVANTLNLPDDSNYIIRGRYLNRPNSYVLSYQGFNAECGQNGSVFLSARTDGEELSLFLNVHGEIYSECNGPYAEQVLPLDWMALTKQ